MTHDPSGRGCAIAGRVMAGDTPPTGDACGACLTENGRADLVWNPGPPSHWPVVHLNGTSRRELIDVRRDAMRALRAAEMALNAMAPNARDYPPPASYMTAVTVYGDRTHAIAKMIEELTAEVIALQSGARP